MSEQNDVVKAEEEQLHRCRLFQRIKVKNIISILSSLLVPAVLGVFTILSTYNQQNETNRQKERDEALQKQQWQIENNRSEQQWRIETERNALQEKIENDRYHQQIQMSLDKYQNDLLVAYIKEMGDMLKENSYSLTHDMKIAALARAKTLSTIRQLDAPRIERILRFLYETTLLTPTNNTEALDLSTASLMNIDKMILKTQKRIGLLSLMGIIFQNCSFKYTSVEDVDFSSVQMNRVDFGGSTISHVDFTSATLENIDALSVDLGYVDFSSGQLNNMNVSSSTLDHVDFSLAILHTIHAESIDLRYVNFTSATLKHVNFSSLHPGYSDHSFITMANSNRTSVNINNVNFKSPKLENCDFLFTQVHDTQFSKGNLEHVRFANARLYRINFVSSTLVDVDFSFAQIISADFSSARLVNVNFSYASLHHVRFSPSSLIDVDFSSAILHNISFVNTKAERMHFTSAVLVHVDFTEAILRQVSFYRARRMVVTFHENQLDTVDFRFANLKGASFSSHIWKHLNFAHANLQMADLSSETLRNLQWNDTLSIHGAKFPRSNTGRDRNLITDGPGLCNISISKSWTYEIGNVSLISLHDQQKRCRFVSNSTVNNAILSQRIPLASIWNSELWPVSYALLNGKMSEDVLIELIGNTRTGSVRNYIIMDSNDTSVRRMRLYEETNELVIKIHFRTNMSTFDQGRGWCDELELFIQYGTEFDPQPGIPDIPPNATWSRKGTIVIEGLKGPWGIVVDREKDTVFAADLGNNRIVAWKLGQLGVRIVAGGQGEGNGLHQLNAPTDVLIDKEIDSIVICDAGNRRVMRWSLRDGTTQGDQIIENIYCWGLSYDYEGSLYVTDIESHQVRAYSNGYSTGVVVAGDKKRGMNLNQLDQPFYATVYGEGTIYVSDNRNHRIVKWMKGAKLGTLFAGGRGQGQTNSQLSEPQGIAVDAHGTIYALEDGNNRATRWRKYNMTADTIVIGDQLLSHVDLSFDRQNNLYISDPDGNRVLRFSIE